MKFTIATKTIKDALNRVSNVTGAAGAVLYSQLIRLKADMNGLNLLRFSNCAKLDLTIEEDCEIEEEGELAVSHTDLQKYINTMPGEKTLIFSNATNLFMSSGNTKGKIAVITEDTNVPPPEDELETESVEVDIANLFRWISSVSPAMGKADSDAAFYGVGFMNIEGKLAIAATNRKTCLVRVTDYEIAVSALLGPQSVEMLKRFLDGAKGDGTLNIGESTLRVTGSNIEASASLQAEKLIDINPILAKAESSIQSKMTVNRGDMESNLRKIAAAKEGIAKLTIAKDSITMTVGDNEKGLQVKMDAACDKVQELGCFPESLADLMNFIDSDDGSNVTIQQSQGMLFVKQPSRIAFAVLAKVQE